MIPIVAKPEEQDFIEEKVSPFIISKDAITRMLKNGIVVVTFVKIDGTQRVMRCTLEPERLPKADIGLLVQEQTNSKPKEDVVAVWDLDKTGWRAFRLNSITAISLEMDNGEQFEIVSL